MRIESASSIGEFVRCPRKYFFRKVLELKVPYVTEEQNIGNIIDCALSEYYKNQQNEDIAYNAVSRFDLKLTEKESELVYNVISNYFKYDKENPLPEGNYLVQTDFFNTDFVDQGVTISGRPDLVIVTEDKIFCVDHKTTSRMWSMEDAMLSFQGEVYSYILEQFYKKPVEVIFNVILRKYPSYPRINKDGTVSRQRISTTKKMFIEIIKKVGGNIEDYQDYIDNIVEENYVSRLHVTFDSKATRFNLSNILHIMNEMRRTFYYRSPLPICKTTCPYYQVCSATGNDLNNILNARQYLPDYLEKEEG